MPGWCNPSEVVTHVDVAGSQVSEVPLINACAAAEAWVEKTARPDLPWSTVGFTVPADVKLGGLMLAWRWCERRSSPLGTLASPTGEPLEMLREDPDIAKLLGVGGRKFAFGASPAWKTNTGHTGIVTT